LGKFNEDLKNFGILYNIDNNRPMGAS